MLFFLAGHPGTLERLTLGLTEGAAASGCRIAPAVWSARLPRGWRSCDSRAGCWRPSGLSLPLWLSIALGIWLVTRAFHIEMPFTGSFLIVALLVVGVAVPTPGAVGGFHYFYRLGATAFFAASNDRAVGAAHRAARGVVRAGGHRRVDPAGAGRAEPVAAGRAGTDQRRGGRSVKCPYCAHLGDKVVDSRESKEGEVIRRRRECLECGRRFTSYERIDEIPYMVVKKDGSRERFERQKLVAGLLKACEKRPVSVAQVEAVADKVEASLQERPEKEIATAEIGQAVMEELKRLDKVAYVRFASVYRHFRDIGEFMNELKDLLNTRE